MNMPIYANGAVTCAADALDFLEQTGAAGVSIGRAVLKAPWIFDDIQRLRRGEKAPVRDAAERVGLLIRLGALACRHRPERVAICEMRKFCGWLLPGFTGAEGVLKALNHVVTLDGYERLLDGYLKMLTREGDLMPHEELMPERTLDTVYKR